MPPLNLASVSSALSPEEKNSPMKIVSIATNEFFLMMTPSS